MTTPAWVIMLIGILIAIAIAGYMAWQSRRTQNMRSRFGPEYDHLLHERGSRTQAEKELEYRAKRVEQFHIRPLSPEESNRFATEWRAAQQRFVDDPRGAVAEASDLLHRVMEARGYPIQGDFYERSADLSVNHAQLVEHYRAGCEIAVRDARQPVSTEELREAMKHYRELFEDLLDRRITEVHEVKQ
jgi:hypothetical protein